MAELTGGKNMQLPSNTPSAPGAALPILSKIGQIFPGRPFNQPTAEELAAQKAQQLRDAEQQRAEDEQTRTLQEQLALETRLRRKNLGGGFALSQLGTG